MQTFKRLGMIIALSALSLSSAWATGDSAFVAKAKLDGFKAVPPVLTSKTGEVCLEFKTQESTAAIGEALAQGLAGFSDLIFPEALAQLAGNPGGLNKRPFDEEGPPTNNIRLYFGQPFANGRPIATLCDNAIRTLKCVNKFPSPIPSTADEFFDFSGFRLSDILFEGQQIRSTGLTLTIAGIRLFFPDPETDDPPDITPIGGNAFRLENTESALALITVLIGRRLIYVVVDSKFEARLSKGKIIGYRPRTGVIDGGDGEIRGTLRLARKGFLCPPPPEPAPEPVPDH